MSRPPKTRLWLFGHHGLVAMATLGLLACSGLTGGNGATGGGNTSLDEAQQNSSNNISNDIKGDTKDDPAGSEFYITRASTDNSGDSTNSSGLDSGWTMAANDPVGVSGLDPAKDVAMSYPIYFNKFTVECKISSENKIKIKLEGNVKTKSGNERRFRIVEKPTKQYMDVETDQSTGGYVSFEIVTKPSLPLKFYMLPLNYPDGPLNTLLPCENQACVKVDKEPIKIWPVLMTEHYDPSHIVAPECPHLEAVHLTPSTLNFSLIQGSVGLGGNNGGNGDSDGDSIHYPNFQVSPFPDDH